MIVSSTDDRTGMDRPNMAALVPVGRRVSDGRSRGSDTPVHLIRCEVTSSYVIGTEGQVNEGRET